MFHYLLSDEFESQKNLDADLILFVRRFKLIGLANKSTIPENLLGGSSAQIPVKTIAKQMKKSRNRFRLKGGFDAKKNEKKHMWMIQKLFFRFRITLNLMKIRATVTGYAMW